MTAVKMTEVETKQATATGHSSHQHKHKTETNSYQTWSSDPFLLRQIWQTGGSRVRIWESHGERGSGESP